MSQCGECGCKDGDRGPMGLQGEKGDTGSSGLPGPAGPMGTQGIQGPQGLQGDKGDTGPQGAPGSSIGGSTGPTGAQGIQGIQGIPGADGADGADGANGANGQGRLNYIEITSVGTVTLTPVVNQGLVMKNTGGVATIELPLGALIGDCMSVVGTSFGTGGWKLRALGTNTIQLTSQSSGAFETIPGGEVVIPVTNYRDVISMVSDGLGNWIITDAIFANNQIPQFS